VTWETITKLKPAVTRNPLWRGSMLSLAHEHGLLTYSMISARAQLYQRAPDLTSEESELLAALQQTLADFKAAWEFI
jgi:hypothetical protein